MSNEVNRAKAMMEMARSHGAPTEVQEEQPSVPVVEPMQPSAQPVPQAVGAEMTVNDFLSATNREQYVSKYWERKQKSIKVKKFCKGELDKISAPLMRKSLSIDVTADKKQRVAPKLEVSMEIFTEMEKNLVELGMSFYKVDNKPVITRHYIDTVMEDDDFKDLSALIQEVNPRALTSNVQRNEEMEELKNE